MNYETKVHLFPTRKNHKRTNDNFNTPMTALPLKLLYLNVITFHESFRKHFKGNYNMKSMERK